MSSKAQMSVNTKKTLLVIGVIFGTIFLFVVSFFLSLYFIINPVQVSAPDDGEVVAENQKLQTQIQLLEEEIERLNVTVEKNKSNINPPAPADIPTLPTPSEENKPVPNEEKSTSNKGAEEDEGKSTTESEEFLPDTVVTPEGGYEPENDIEIIDISE